MVAQLMLRKVDFFASAGQAVAVADRYPQNVFAEHTHEFCELVLVWRGNGLHILNDRPYRITRGDLFYIRALIIILSADGADMLTIFALMYILM